MITASKPSGSFVLILAASLAAACGVDRSATASLEARAKVSRAAAEKTALAQVPGGTVTGGGIEEENGKLLWSFDVTDPASKSAREIAIDAITGLAEPPTKSESAAKETPEADEKKAAGQKDEKDEKDEVVNIAQVPAVVKATLQPFATEAEVKKVEKGDVDGTLAYEFVVERAGHKLEVAITPDGKLLGTEEIVELADLPAAVKKTIVDKSVGGRLVSVEKVVAGGKTTYEAVIEKQGKQTEIVVGLDGKVGGSES